MYQCKTDTKRVLPVFTHLLFHNPDTLKNSSILRLYLGKRVTGRSSSQYIKRDSSICENKSMSDLECFRHFNALPKTICPVCKMGTYSDTGICNTNSGIYDHA
jgi:hypothetical protein